MLWAVWGFACSFYQSGSAWTLFFFVRFPSLGIIILGFIHVEVYSYFIVSNCWEPRDYTTIGWIHLSMTYLGCLQAWVISHGAALNFHGQSFVWTWASVFWHRQLGVERVLHRVSVFSSQCVSSAKEWLLWWHFHAQLHATLFIFVTHIAYSWPPSLLGSLSSLNASFLLPSCLSFL